MTVGLAWPGATAAGAVVAMMTGAVADLALEAIRSSLPPALEPGLAGAAVGTLALVLVSVLGPRLSGARTPEPASHDLDP